MFRTDMFTQSHKGFTLVETLVGLAVFVMISLAVYEAFTTVSAVARVSNYKVTAAALANEQIEIIRNLSYDDVGVSGSIPNGVVPYEQNLTRGGIPFTVRSTIRNIDDPFDGQIGSTTNDLSPADYRLVEVEILCDTCIDYTPMAFTAYVGPRGLETASGNGALFVQVFDADGQPVQGANVVVENDAESIVINDTTNNDGFLQIVDAPPGVGAYEVWVSKPGYSSDRSYLVGDAANPNPITPHPTVVTQSLSQVSFAIDETSTLDVSSVTDTCAPVGGIDFDLAGSKLIGTAPDVLKFSDSYTTNGAGRATLNDIEWDTYTLDFTETSYDLAGTIPATQLVINAGVDQDVTLVVAPHTPNALLVTVKDSATQLPLTDVTVRLEGSGYDTTYTTGRGFLRQTDWSGGSGQVDFTDADEYFDDDSDIEVASPAGELRLQEVLGEYQATGYLTSSTFNTGSPSNFHQILWQPLAQPPDVGPDGVRMQVATNNDNATWNFLGPDGTASTYYDLTNQELNAVHDGNQFFRYRVFLETASTTWTPTVSDISFTFTSDCVPPGQVLFSGLTPDSYTLTVSKSGYATDIRSVNVAADWQQEEIILGL